MDWYLGSGIDDLVVPKDGELPDRLPSPDSWFKWGMNAPQSFGSDNKYFTMDSDLPQEELNLNGKRSSCYNDEMGASVNSKDHSSGSSICGGELSNSIAVSQDYQLDDFPGIEQMDDIFLSSLLDDLPVIESFRKSVCVSPGLEIDTKPSESVLTQMVDSQSDINNIESSKYARTDGTYTPVDWESGRATSCKSEQKGLTPPPVKVEHFSHSEENSTSGCVGEETSLEESILQDFEIAMTQLTEQTRICFRDALYRLAKNSTQHSVDGSQTGDPLAEEPRPWTSHDETIRPETRKPVVESQTNTIDRAIANLMFGEMESNARNISLAVPTNLKQEGTEAFGQHSYCSSQQDHKAPCDTQVPFNGHRELATCTSSM